MLNRDAGGMMTVIYNEKDWELKNPPVREHGECGMSALKDSCPSTTVTITRSGNSSKRVTLRELTFK